MKKVIRLIALVLICCTACVTANAQITREVFVETVLENGGISQRIYAESFADVDYTDEFSDYVQAALETGIIDKDEFFRPFESITVSEASEMVKKALTYLKYDFDEAAFDVFVGSEPLEKKVSDQLIEKMMDICDNSRIKTNDPELDKKLNFVRENADSCKNEAIKEIVKEYFDSGFKKVMQNNSEKEYTRGSEEISLAYGALNYDRESILTGEYIFDDNGGLIQGHGGNVFFDEKSSKYYWYGEARQTSDPPKHLKKYADWGWRIGVACYSSEDLYNWRYEGLALEMLESYWGMKFPQSDIRVGEVLERPKVIYNKKTDKYVMWMHIDTGNYGYARAGVAISDSPTGPFEYITSYRPKDKMSRDMTVFQDNDGSAYIYFSTDENASLACSRLSDDYLEPVGEVYYCIERKWREAPAVFRYQDTYYMITSCCTGWDPNEADYATAPAPTGPWTQRGNPCVGEGSEKTYGGQSYWVMPLDAERGRFIFMADIWRPSRHSESGFIWLPIQIQPDGSIRIEWLDEWQTEDIGSMALQPEDVTAIYGQEVKLPENVRVIVNGSEEEREVEWEKLSTNAPGTHIVNGSVKNSGFAVSVKVHIIPEKTVYFINCGADNKDEFNKFAKDTYNSSPDCEYSEDPLTGRMWGYVSDNESGAKGGAIMTDSVRYDYSDGGEENIGKGITYKLEVEQDKEYAVFIGVNDPWGEDARCIDLLVNGNIIADGHYTKDGYQVFLARHVTGQNNEIQVSSVRDEKATESQLDPIINWIMVVEGDVAELIDIKPETFEKGIEESYENREEIVINRTLRLKDTVLALTYDYAGGLRAEALKGTKNQKWNLEYTLTGSYLINALSPYSDNNGNTEVRCLDVSGGSKDEEAEVIDYKKTYGDNQKWFFEKQSDGSYLIKSENSDLYLTYKNGHFIQSKKGEEYQKWVLDVVE